MGFPPFQLGSGSPRQKFNPKPFVTQKPKSQTQNPRPKIQNPKPKDLNPKPKIQNQKTKPQSKIQNPNSKTQNPKHKILNPKPKKILNHKRHEARQTRRPGKWPSAKEQALQKWQPFISTRSGRKREPQAKISAPRNLWPKNQNPKIKIQNQKPTTPT